MSNNVCISVIVPFYNAESYLDKCINSVLNQTFLKTFEVIFVDDASIDKGKEIFKKYNSKLIKLYSLENNSGPGVARNEGLKHAKGDYIYFLDVDDWISPETLKILYDHVSEKNYDLIFSDKKIIKNGVNLRENKYLFSSNREFNKKEITELMLKRIQDPLHALGILGITGRLIKSSIIKDNKINFETKLRFLEDETFSWDFLAYCENAKYVEHQLYSYYVYPNTQSGISQGIEKGFIIENFKILKKHVSNSLVKRNISIQNVNQLSDHAFIFFIITTLISFSRSIYLGKVERALGKKIIKRLIKMIIDDKEVEKSIKNYQISKLENKWIPIGIKWKNAFIIRYASTLRARELVKLRGN